MNTAKATQYKNALLAVGGLVAGFMNGLLGAGGGILVVWILGSVLSTDRKDTQTGFDKRDVFACALASMLPVTAVSAISYTVQGSLPLDSVEQFILPAIIGGVGGAFLLDRMKTETVRKIFTVIIIYSGIAMLIRN